jgi:hypothetical protein
MKIIDKILLLGIIGIIIFSCKKEDKEIDPAKAILGKWVLIEMGNWPIMDPITEPNGYKEYLTDSILLEYEYKTGNIFVKKYWVDSLLHVSVSNGGSPQLLFEYKYEFYDNKLRLDVTNFYMLYSSSIYKRIN